MSEPVKKRVDETWKEQAEREKHQPAASRAEPAERQPAQPSAGQPAASTAAPARDEMPPPKFELFVSSLAMETLIALGDMPHPATKRQSVNLAQAKYLIDLIGMLEEKTKNNLDVDEDRLLKDTLYQLRMRYLNKSGGAA
jgi:hypothetical protein